MRYDPSAALKELATIAATPTLLPYERQEIRGWISAFGRWRNEEDLLLPPLRRAEALLHPLLASKEPLFAELGPVELLRAAGHLHRALEDDDFRAETRGKALYWLGLTYAKLGPLYIEEAPELYLERCMDEFPKSSYAKMAFDLYQELIRVDFTGSSGTHIPQDLKRKIDKYFERCCRN